MDPITIDLSLLVTIMGLGSAVGAALWQIHKLVGRFEKLEKRANYRKDDSLIMMEALQACLDGLQQVGANHNVTEMDKKLQAYIRESR